jgi:hypothetical protein
MCQVIKMSIKQLRQKIDHNGASDLDPMISPFLEKITYLSGWAVAGIYGEWRLVKTHRSRATQFVLRRDASKMTGPMYCIW